MQIKVNNKEYNIPFDPQTITLDEYIEFYQKYGKDLEKKLRETEAEKFEDEIDKQIAIDNLVDEEALAWFSYWSGIDLTDCRNEPEIAPLLERYRMMRVLFFDSEKEAEEKYSECITWRAEKWYIQDWKINPTSKMTANEIITSKEIMRQVVKFESGRWAALKYLAAVFLRKENEAFKDELVYEGGERLQLIGELPVAYALRIGFFLSACVGTLKNLLVFSQEVETYQNLN